VPLPASLSVDELKLRVDKKLSSDDPLLAAFLATALRTVQAPAPLGCGRVLLPDPEPQIEGDGEEAKDESEPVVRVFRVRHQRVQIPDAREITKVTVDGVEVPPNVGAPGEDWWKGYEVLEQDGLIVQITLPEHHWRYYGTEYDYMPSLRHRRHRRRQVEVTGRFGFAEIPEDMVEGIYSLAARAWYEREAQYADQVAVAEGAPVQSYFRQLPPRTKLAIATYTLPEGLGRLS
jgi:hypothetical protein